MADIKGIELASDIYGLEDETARNDTETNASAIENLTNRVTNTETAIEDIQAVIPSSASPQNKLMTQEEGGVIKGQGEITLSGSSVYDVYISGAGAGANVYKRVTVIVASDGISRADVYQNGPVEAITISTSGLKLIASLPSVPGGAWIYAHKIGNYWD